MGQSLKPRQYDFRKRCFPVLKLLPNPCFVLPFFGLSKEKGCFCSGARPAGSREGEREKKGLGRDGGEEGERREGEGGAAHCHRHCRTDKNAVQGAAKSDAGILSSDMKEKN